LGLNLYYLVTAYGPDNDEVNLFAHQLLGRAMSIFHDRPVLSAEKVNDALSQNDLHNQIERVRITPLPLSLDDMSKLWMTFQTQYRVSAAYEVAVVLIESKRPTKASLPVLRRGDEDRGAFTLASPSPTLREVRSPNRKPSAQLGDILTIYGENLDISANLISRFRHPSLAEPIAIAPLPERKATEIQVKLPSLADDAQVPGKLPAGFYTFTVVVQLPNLPTWTTNELALALAPQIAIAAPAVPIPGELPQAPQGDVTLTLTCIPQVRPEQRVVLLFGDRQVPVKSIFTPPDPADPTKPDLTAATTLTFLVEKALPGIYVLRLRVDGVDSIPVDFTTSPPQFADNQKVKINE
jgi:hypothetical protein